MLNIQFSSEARIAIFSAMLESDLWNQPRNTDYADLNP